MTPLILSYLCFFILLKFILIARIGGVFLYRPILWVWGLGAAAFTYIALIFFLVGWQPGLASTLMAAIALQGLLLSLLVLFKGRLKPTSEAMKIMRLLPLFMPYAWFIGGIGLLLAVFLQGAYPTIASNFIGKLIIFHILVAVTGYSLIALAGLSGLAVLLRRYDLRASQNSAWLKRFTAQLPALNEAIKLQQSFLLWALMILLLGILSGLGLNWYSHDNMFILNHKILLTLAGFMLTLFILIMDRWLGMGAKRIAHAALLSFLLITLAYPGVKFVSEFLLP